MASDNESAATQGKASFFSRVFGNWQPPGWLAGSLRWLLAKPRLRIGAPLLLLAIAGLASWFVTRETPPPADAISVEVGAPAITDYSQTPVTVNPLRIIFSASVAPLDAVGSEEGSAKPVEGIELSPQLAGRWSFDDDRTLSFKPAEDWPVGQEYTVMIDPDKALAPDRTLEQNQFVFATAAFSMTIDSAEFYQDPEDRNLKRAVWALSFSHPVDIDSLQSRVTLSALDGANRALETPQVSQRGDEIGLKRWIQTSALTVPENGGIVQLQLARGIKSRLPGPGVAEKQESQVALPSLYSVALNDVSAQVVDNQRSEPEQVLVLNFNDTLKDSEVLSNVKLWLLPERFVERPGHPAKNNDYLQKQVPYPWNEGEMDSALLNAGKLLKLEAIPTEREWIETHTLRFKAPPGRRLWLEASKGLKSFGGFILGKSQRRLLEVPQYPTLLRFVGDGALLSLRGEQRVSIVARNLTDARLEIGRVLPEQLQQLIAANDGSFDKPSFWRVEEDTLVERFEETLQIVNDDPAKASYRGVDLSSYFSAAQRGVFMLSLRTMNKDEAMLSPRERIDRDVGSQTDSRLVVLTDLGVLAKKELDGQRRVFVQSLSSGTPVSGAHVAVIGRNGQVVTSASTKDNGEALLPTFTPFVRERYPIMLQVTNGDDMSFLPLGDYARQLDASRFDIGGEISVADPATLNAVLFSDRGLYRPGEKANIGMILRAQDWKLTPIDVPLQVEVNDPTGALAHRSTIRFGAAGFEEYAFTPPAAGPSGTWQVQLYLKSNDDQPERKLIGSTSVQVREFQPDTLRVALDLSQPDEAGWVRPAQLKALVNVENLFGTPAQDRRVTSQLRLTPSLPSFSAWPGFRFSDPQTAREGVSETLEEVRTNSDGKAEITLGLEQYERASYRLDLLVRAFEPGSGRGVASTLRALVSDQPYLVGLKASDGLNYVNRDSKQSIELLVLGPDGKPTAIDNLQAVRIEKRMVSVLTRGDDGLYRFVSRERREERERQPLKALTGKQSIALNTQTPGDFVLDIVDADGRVLNSQNWTVAGNANLSRSLERNAELELSLSKPIYSTGEEIEVSIRAPYVGAGLITIERDRVFTSQWFKADTTSSVQRIRLPEGIEGNAYLSVQMLRDPSSEDVYTSPLSWAVAPFKIDRSSRELTLNLDAPKRARPGQPLSIKISNDGSARVAVFAVDEGILQVAGYRVSSPLDTFFAKRMHQIETAQILDLLLPEFSRLTGGLAPGGDGAGEGARHLNPFKRKGEQPAVWWSGIVDVDGEKTLQFTPPDHFNGELRLVAVAVTPEKIALAEKATTVRGDFVLSPTLPTHVAPGDVFELPVGIANTIENATAASDVTLTVELPKALSLVGDPLKPLSIKPGEEKVQTIRLKAAQSLGAQAITLRASSGRFAAARKLDVSVRPLVPSMATVKIRRVRNTETFDQLTPLFDQRATRTLAVSSSPLVTLASLQTWLGEYKYMCTEQLVSKAMPAIVLRSHPEFGSVTGDADLSGLFNTLRNRQNDEGGFGYWAATPDVNAFVSAYSTLVLVEARERGIRVPEDLLDQANRWLAQAAVDPSATDLHNLRARAIAVYLQIRQGEAAGNALSALVEQLERDQPKTWRDDVTGMLVAASYQRLQQDKAAAPLAKRGLVLANQPTAPSDSNDFYDPVGAQAWRLYLLGKHFPQLAQGLNEAALAALIGPLTDTGLNSLNASLALLALDAQVAQIGPAKARLEQYTAAGKREFGSDRGSVRSGSFAGDVSKLTVTALEKPVWAALTQSGFDRSPPAAVQDRGLEIQRDFLDASGKPTTTVVQGQELTVRLRVRGQGWSNIAIVDLLPGGFESVLTPVSAAESATQATDESSESEDESEQEGQSEPAAPALRLSESTLIADHEEIREDRVVLYSYANQDLQEYRYRIRATAVGEFQVPPVFAEHMYRATVFARGGPAGKLVVTAPER